MIVRELLDRLNIKEEDVIRIGENSYSRNELYSLPKNELIFDKEVSEIYINVCDYDIGTFENSCLLFMRNCLQLR